MSLTIEVEGVAKSFGDTRALDGVSFTAGPGEVVGLLGPNGAGKTTLVRILATLLRPDSGTARIGGVDVVRDPATARQFLGLAGQSAAVDELLTGRENLELIGALYGLERSVSRRRATEILDRFDLTDAAGRRVGTYSGGMRRRLDLGATLIGRPAVILLDEPTAGLDPRSRSELWSLVRGVAADGTTVLLTSQYLEEVERLAADVVVIDRGVVIADAAPDELKRAVAPEVLETRLAENADVRAAAALLGDLGDEAPAVDLHSRRVAVPTSGGISTLVTAARRLDEAGVELLDLGLRRPSLDDVFLALTGENSRAAPINGRRPQSTEVAAPTPRPRRPFQSVRDMAAASGRYLRRFARTPQMYIFGAAQPAMFVLGLHAAFGGLVEHFTNTAYIQYLLPGVAVMNVLFAASITSVGFAEDLQAGILDRFRSLPMSRSALLVGRTVADLTRNALAIVIVVVLGYALGFRFHGSPLAAAGCLGLLLGFSYAVTWLFACLGMAVRTPQVAQLASFLPVLPLIYVSGAWIPVETMPASLQGFARNQPVNVFVEALRSAADGTPMGNWGWQAAAWTVAIFCISVPLAIRLYRGDGS